MSVRGFPSVYIADATSRTEFVYGCKPYEAYQAAIQKLLPRAVPQPYDQSWQSLFAKFQTLTTREFSELSELPAAEAAQLLNKLLHESHIQVYHSKNGPLWSSPPAP